MSTSLSLSDTTWVFLHGKHWLWQDHKLEIVGAGNVTLKGDEECAVGVEECILALWYQPTINFKTGSQFLVKDSSHIAIENLKVETNTISVVHTSNLCIRSVDFQSTALVIEDPIGDYIICGVHFGPSSYLATAVTACPYTTAEECNFSFTLDQCVKWEETKTFVFGTDPIAELHITLGMNSQYHSIKIIIVNSTFNNSAVNMEVYHSSIMALEFSNISVNSSKVGLTMALMESMTYSEPVEEWLGAHVVVTGCTFVETELAIQLLSPRGSRDILKDVTIKHPEIVISHTNFEDEKIKSVKHYYKLSVKISDSTHNTYATNHGALLTILHSSFKGAWLAAITLRNLLGYRVVMAGGNQIVSNHGSGLVLKNTQVEFHGYNEISRNRFEEKVHPWPSVTGGGMYIAPDSQLLLALGTLLNVSANACKPYGGGICIDGEETELTDFVDCHVDKLTCPGWCFFQFINSDGQYVNASDIPEHNATVILSRNTATLGGNNVFNGHFQNCSLQTAHGTTPAHRELILSVFHQYPPIEEKAIPSFPYAICLCDGDELNCIRNHTLVIETYPVQQFAIFVTVLGDWQHEIPVRLTVTVTQTQAETMQDINGCTKVYTLEHPMETSPGSTPEMSLKASLMNSDAVLQRSIAIRVFNGCSSGLQYKHKQCVCNTFLEQHRFTCTIVTNTTTYKADRPHYWIGIEEEHVIISPNCPLSFCNSVLQSGVTIGSKSDDSLQCNNGRQGLLCSECPSGYSSVFGSFKCKECSSVWLFQLPLYAFAGIFIVALLFLFNLTLLQGTIMGVVLYTNIMALMADFLQEHVWGPLFFLLSVLNLQSGAGVCFYDGMDEFWKALIQFAFPFYLFTLLIVIIIITHKCGYRMFRKARFIARRAVPVLATIMLLTYTSLVNAAIAPLRYTTLYNADSTQGETVWLYQPSLPFFGGRHIVLGILSIAVTLLYLIPFTFTMLFGDLIRRYFHKLWFSHFMDVLHGASRWPLGFWIGVRLLVRVILVVLDISTNPNTSAFCSLVVAGSLLVVQLLVRPFRDPNSFREDIHLQGPPSCKRQCLTWIKQFLNTYHAPLFDTLYLLNIVQTSAMVSFGTSSQTLVLSAAGSNILILLALAQFAAILVYHAYNFFPLPEKACNCAQSCWSTMHAISSMLKDTQCCQSGPREEEEGPRRSPTPILSLRPPEIDESYESESETSSYNEQLPPEEAELKESALQEPLLAHGN